MVTSPCLLSLLYSIGCSYKFFTVFRFCYLQATYKGKRDPVQVSLGTRCLSILTHAFSTENGLFVIICRTVCSLLTKRTSVFFRCTFDFMLLF